MAEFEGFSQGTVDFLWGIRLHNERAWFQEHKREYLELADAPLRALSARLLAAMNEEYPRLSLREHVSRIYRDARRLYGRGPYKDHLWLVLARPEGDHLDAPALYFELAPNEYSYGCGYWDMRPETAAKLRARIDRDPKPLEKLARRLNRSPFTLSGARYKRPKGDPGPLLFPWYNSRNITLDRAENCEGVFFTPRLYDEVLEGFRFLVPYYQYFASLAAEPPPKNN